MTESLHTFHPELCHVHINDMLKDVYTSGGRVFGSYARDVIFQDMFERPLLPFSSVDIWFSSREQFDRFIEINEGAVTCGKMEWTSNFKYQYAPSTLSHNGVSITPVNIYINKSTIPFYLFDIDNIVFGINIEDDFWTPRYYGVNGWSEKKVLESFKAKTAIVINTPTNDDISNLISKGWKVVLRDGTPISSTTDIKTLPNITNNDLKGLDI
jgi:hypothetical protein